jgi:hypothetical protein
MGWASANEIFDPVARKTAELGIPDGQRADLLETLIRQLQQGDWDTEDESLSQFENDPAVVEAFRRCDIIVHCGAAGEEDGGYCELERGHGGDFHEDWDKRRWPVAGATTNYETDPH